MCIADILKIMFQGYTEDLACSPILVLSRIQIRSEVFHSYFFFSCLHIFCTKSFRTDSIGFDLMVEKSSFLKRKVLHFWMLSTSFL